ncbi:uncharacterized protein LOC126953309 [Macaca thibetana thibetana]|uniref:uncharacterized protein LOC126953309 n=1 Tax=Macaca thibetana thibetana TaxID=257877 RepID=UPI0021BCBD28|nr:uncharacterized protein LOC126953309 [Macaca thibetana thibetana]
MDGGTVNCSLDVPDAVNEGTDGLGSQAEGIFLVLDETFDLDFWVKGTKEENQWQKSHVQARWESGEPQAKSPVLSPVLFKVHDHHDAPLCGYHRNGNLRPYEVVYPNLG